MAEAPVNETKGGYVFEAVRGIQAGREYYVTMCPLGMVPRIFVFDGEELAPEDRAQRQLNKGRVPALARYLTANPDSYVFSAITASIDGEISFVPASSAVLGHLHVPFGATFIVNDGQHRRAAIELAIKECRSLGDETIAVVFFHDRGLERCQQMFADLNRYAIRPSSSLSVLYDHRDDRARLARLVLERLPRFNDLVDGERASLSSGSRKLFTLSAMHKATQQLLSQIDLAEQRDDLVVAFWQLIYDVLPEWDAVSRGDTSAGSVRATYVHSHGVILHALGRTANSLLHRSGEIDALTGVSDIDWRRAAACWEGRSVSGGNLTNSSRSVMLSSNLMKKHIGVELSAEERRQESTMKKART